MCLIENSKKNGNTTNNIAKTIKILLEKEKKNKKIYIVKKTNWTYLKKKKNITKKIYWNWKKKHNVLFVIQLLQKEKYSDTNKHINVNLIYFE